MTTPFSLLLDVNTRRRTALAPLLGVLAATLSAPALAAEIGDPGLGYDRVLGFNFGVGDFNGDGDDDLAMGVPWRQATSTRMAIWMASRILW